jgi:hypothetical protein
MFMRKMTVFTLSAGLALASAGAYAASVHLKSGPSFVDNGLTLTALGALAGLGNQDLEIFLTARANPIATCTNPSGQQQPPGQNPAPVSVAANPLSIPASEIKNGNVSFSVTTLPPTTPIPGAPDCPNSKWTEAITDLQFTSATIIVEQPPPTIVLTVQCTFAPPTINGPVTKQTVTCR